MFKKYTVAIYADTASANVVMPILQQPRSINTSHYSCCQS